MREEVSSSRLNVFSVSPLRIMITLVNNACHLNVIRGRVGGAGIYSVVSVVSDGLRLGVSRGHVFEAGGGMC